MVNPQGQSMTKVVEDEVHSTEHKRHKWAERSKVPLSNRTSVLRDYLDSFQHPKVKSKEERNSYSHWLNIREMYNLTSVSLHKGDLRYNHCTEAKFDFVKHV